MPAETIYEMLLRHEGLKLKPYPDTEGKMTIGVGRNLEDTGISEGEAFMLLNNDVNRARRGLDKYLPWWHEQPEPVKLVMQDMGFQLGITGLLGFERSLEAIRRQRYTVAAAEMLDSEWARQTPNRAKELAALVAVQKQTETG